MRLDISATKSSSNCSRTDSSTINRFAATQLCPALTRRANAQSAAVRPKFDVVQYQVGIAAAQLQNCFLERGARPGRHGLSGRCAAGQGDGPNPGIVDQDTDAGSRNEYRVKDSRFETRPVENVRNRQGTARNVGCVFQNRRIPGHQGRSRKSKHLPEREIPWHDRENDAQGFKNNLARHRPGLDRLGIEKGPGVIGVILQHPGAFPGLGTTLCNRLAHFQGHEFGERLLLITKDCRGPAHPLCPVIEAARAPVLERPMGRCDRIVHRFGRVLFVGPDCPSGVRVDGFDRQIDLQNLFIKCFILYDLN